MEQFSESYWTLRHVALTPRAATSASGDRVNGYNDCLNNHLVNAAWGSAGTQKGTMYFRCWCYKDVQSQHTWVAHLREARGRGSATSYLMELHQLIYWVRVGQGAGWWTRIMVIDSMHILPQRCFLARVVWAYSVSESASEGGASGKERKRSGVMFKEALGEIEAGSIVEVSERVEQGRVGKECACPIRAAENSPRWTCNSTTWWILMVSIHRRRASGVT
ncbi:hypothetical protein BD779DRAFT_1785346 [Infundibulicybe gibba]|nr:hypothetical protein BD779DRAFT_1785346 [Infundibulicybe gibba]